MQKHAAAAAAGEDVIKELLSQANSDDEGTENSSSSSLTINLDGVVLESEDTGRVTELEVQLEAAHRRIKELEEQNSALQKSKHFSLDNYCLYWEGKVAIIS